MADKIKKLPGDVSHLQRLIGDHAPTRGMPPARLQRWLNAMIVTAVLDRVRDEDGEPIFLLKGGVAMELRLQLRARATGDYDAAFRARAEEVIDHLDEALAQPWNNFDLTRDAPETIPNTQAVRDKHTWPPTVTVYDSWRVPFAELARENGFTPEDIGEAAVALTALIAAIGAANESESAESARYP